MTSESGSPTQDMEFYPWGGAWNTSGGGGLEFADLAYDDASTNSQLATYRLFSGNLGRWHSPDPIAGNPTNPQSWNMYAYVANNPTTSIDPLGLCSSVGPGGGFDCSPEEAAQSNYSDPLGIFGILGGGGGGGGDCTVDGSPTNCALALGLANGGTAVRCPGSCSALLEIPNGGLLPMQYQAIWSGGYFSPLLPGEYSSADEAGIIAAAAINFGSIGTNTEFGGNIYRLANGMYSFTLPVSGGPDSVDFAGNVPSGTVAVGDYHTHAAYDPGFDNEIFSSGAQDTDLYGRTLPGYLATPSWRIEVYNPSQAGQYPLGCVLSGPPVPGTPGVPVCH